MRHLLHGIWVSLLAIALLSCDDNTTNTGVTADDIARHDKEVERYNALKASGEYTEHKNMLLYKKTKENAEGRSIAPGQTLYVHYRGMLMDSTEFDSSYKNKRPLYATVASGGTGGLIEGWAEGLTLFKEGEKGTLIIKPKHAYGDQGRSSIPPRSHLIFDIHITLVDQF